MKRIIFGIGLLVMTGFIYAQAETAEWNWTQVSVSSNHTAAIRADGTLWTWGKNDQGKLGDGTTNDSSVPVQVGTATNWISVAAGGIYTAAVRADGTLWAWGSNLYGQFGNGNRGFFSEGNQHRIHGNLTPVRIGTATNWASVYSGGRLTIALRTDGSLWGWGILGFNGFTIHDYGTTPVRIGTVWASVSVGTSHVAAISRDGSLWSWGHNRNGQLGDGTTIERTAPVRVGTDTDWASVFAGYSHTVAIKKNGTLWAWGNNDYGQLGNETQISVFTPVQIGTDTDWASVSVNSGWGYNRAVKTNGELWGWGGGRRLSTPVRIGTDSNWASAFARGVIRKIDGTLWVCENIDEKWIIRPYLTQDIFD
ncbi:MAG: hypothetical protein FWD26_02430 [Treponema sp.]|nr:hypothetical protein [Treponema sp.]